jgi:hypothetical protein
MQTNFLENYKVWRAKFFSVPLDKIEQYGHVPLK